MEGKMIEFISCRFVDSEEGRRMLVHIDKPELKIMNIDLSREPRPKYEVTENGELKINP